MLDDDSGTLARGYGDDTGAVPLVWRQLNTDASAPAPTAVSSAMASITSEPIPSGAPLDKELPETTATETSPPPITAAPPVCAGNHHQRERHWRPLSLGV
jgi:hypothetical protein